MGVTARSYDAAGNTTAIGGTAKEFVYDDTGRMSQVKQNAIVQRSYAYNGKGEQVRKYAGTTNTYTLYDEAGHWLGDYDNTGAALQQAIWLDDLPVGLIANGNQLHYIEPDHLGTPRVVIEVARNVPVWTWDLKSEAFGNSVPNQDPDGDANPLVFDMRFPGQRFDVDAGVNQNGFRSYDNDTGRYLESDPIGLSGGVSSYSYSGGQPTMAIDPLGLQYAEPSDVSWCKLNPAACVAVLGGGAATVALPHADIGTKAECAEDDRCAYLVREMKKAMQEIEGRIEARLVDKCDMYNKARSAPNPLLGPGCPGSWNGHAQQIEDWQNRLKNLISEALRNNCHIPFGAFASAYRGLPRFPRGYPRG